MVEETTQTKGQEQASLCQTDRCPKCGLHILRTKQESLKILKRILEAWADLGDENKQIDKRYKG